ncbi:MAG: hypothetical protein IT353_19465 [Gemmatimonadaceae bacterium]|nr:hypothetical protein [Gemmatimonadaceae bacterium]
MTRHHVLRLVILLLAAANIFGLYLGLTQRAMLFSMCTRLSDVWPIYLASPVATLLGLGGLWNQRRWGAWLCIGMAMVVLGLELYGCGPAAHVMRIPVALAVLTAAVWVNRSSLR